MKFLIWGAGVRGRRVRYFLGDSAVAYIDSNPSLCGKVEDSLPILSAEEYLSDRAVRYRDAWIIISPRSTKFINEIANLLDANGVVKYFRLQDAIASYYEYDAVKMIEAIEQDFSQEKEIGLRGLDCFHADLYRRLSEEGCHPVLWITQKDLEKEAARCSELSGWDIRCLDETNPPKLLDDAELLERLKNIYETPAMKKFHNMYAGCRCFVVATGPSLRMEDLETLHEHHELCISMNGIFHCFDQVKWRPDFFMMTDQLLVAYQDIIDTMDVPCKIISDSNLDFWKKKHPENVYRMHVIYGHEMDEEHCFSDDFLKGCYGNFNVTNACLQFAVYLGCHEIYLLGVDFFASSAKKKVDHFTNAYEKGTKTQVQTSPYDVEMLKELQLEGYLAAKRYADHHPNVKFYNATRGGALEVFERVDFDSLF